MYQCYFLQRHPGATPSTTRAVSASSSGNSPILLSSWTNLSSPSSGSNLRPSVSPPSDGQSKTKSRMNILPKRNNTKHFSGPSASGSFPCPSSFPNFLWAQVCNLIYIFRNRSDAKRNDSYIGFMGGGGGHRPFSAAEKIIHFGFSINIRTCTKPAPFLS